jgi:uncharacterized protein YjiK
MANTEFIMITIMHHDVETIRYVNRNSVVQVFEKDDKIFIELSGYETLQVKALNIHEFMDRFIK